MGEVVDLAVITKLDLDPQRVLEQALKHGMTEVVIVGFGRDGDLYFASSKSDAGAVLFHFEIAKRRLLDICDT